MKMPPDNSLRPVLPLDRSSRGKISNAPRSRQLEEAPKSRTTVYRSFPPLTGSEHKHGVERRPEDEAVATRTEDRKDSGCKNRSGLAQASISIGSDAGTSQKLLAEVMTSPTLQLFQARELPLVSKSSSCGADSSAKSTVMINDDDSSSFSDSGSSLRPDLCEHSQNNDCRCRFPRERDQEDGLCMLCEAGGCSNGDSRSDDGTERLQDWQIVPKYP